LSGYPKIIHGTLLAKSLRLDNDQNENQIIMNKMKSTYSSRRGSSLPADRDDESESMENRLHAAFLDEVYDLYNAEQQLIKTLPKIARAAQTEELQEAFEGHLRETEEHARRLEQAVESLGESMKRNKCEAMEGLLAEGKEMMDEFKDDPALDAVLISAAQKVEHYEIASYGTLCAWAQRMGHTQALNLFQETLAEEKAADEKLTSIAESIANARAQDAR
jgi:ferritin-like metal-binding protein YciE